MDSKGAGSIGGLVFLIAIFIILYVLVMPPCDKCQLLKQGDCSDVCEESEFKGVLLFDEVGSVGATNEVVHELDPINLYIRVDDEVERLAESLSVDRGWFGNVDQDLSFDVADLDNLDSVYLNFRTEESRGTLFVELNGHTIFSEKISSPAVNKINLPTSYLKGRNNLKLYVDSPGLVFWAKNKYSLKNIEIRQAFETVHYEESRTFSISKNEKKYLSSSSLDYSIFCSSAQGLTVLKIYLNNKLLSSESIECKSSQKSLQLNANDLNTGENELKLVIDNGNFLLSPIQVIGYLEEEINPSYNFNVEESVFDFADNYYLSFIFENSEHKEAKIILNNYNLDLNDDSGYFEKDITSFIRSGNNFLEIVPTNDFVISQLKIWYE